LPHWRHNSETHIRNIYLNKLLYDPPQGPPSLRLHEGAGWIEVAAGFLGGRPQEAASAGDTRLRPVWALKRSTEMTSCLWLTWMVNVLAPWRPPGMGQHMGPPEVSADRQQAHKRVLPGIGEWAVCWWLRHRMLAVWVAAAR
jgi:hypothetical protein